MNHCIYGDCRESMRGLIAEGLRVQCVVTSPPYWGLRSYLEKDDPDKANEMGSEKTPEAYIANMVEVFRLVRELMRDDGVCFINIGDSYAGGAGGRGDRDSEIKRADGTSGKPSQKHNGERIHKSLSGSLKPKDLVGIPWMLAFALRADGWYLRSAIVWAKGLSFCPSYSGSVMPESCQDRPTKAYEMVFLLSKSAHYFYDNEAVKEEYVNQEKESSQRPITGFRETPPGNGEHSALGKPRSEFYKTGGRNLRDVWAINPESYKGNHFATFPRALVEPCVLAGTSERGACPACGAPWGRVIEIEDPNGRLGKGYHDHKDDLKVGQRGVFPAEGAPTKRTAGWRPTCACPPAAPVPCVVFDPFLGSGTTAEVAQALGRNWIGCELNRAYAPLIAKRTMQLSLFGSVLAVATEPVYQKEQAL